MRIEAERAVNQHADVAGLYIRNRKLRCGSYGVETSFLKSSSVVYSKEVLGSAQNFQRAYVEYREHVSRN